MTQAQLRIASADDFLSENEVVQLPSQAGSDAGVLLRRPDIVSMMAAGDGDVPDILSSMVVRMLNEKPGAAGPAQELKITAENLPQVMQSINTIAVAAFVDPPLTLAAEPHDGRIPVSRIKFEDKVFVFGWAIGGEQTAGAQRFPAKARGRAGAVPAKQGVRATPKRGAGDKK